jgi:hypothetical protein
LLALVAATSRASVLSGYVQAAAELGLDHGTDPGRRAAGATGQDRPHSGRHLPVAANSGLR